MFVSSCWDCFKRIIYRYVYKKNYVTISSNILYSHIGIDGLCFSAPNYVFISTYVAMPLSRLSRKRNGSRGAYVFVVLMSVSLGVTEFMGFWNWFVAMLAISTYITLIHNIDNRKCMPLLHNAQNIFTRHELCLIKNASGTNRTM